MSTTEQYSPVMNAEGEVERLRRRVTLLAETNRRLRRRDRMMRQATDGAGVGWWVLDPERKTLEASAAFKSSFGRRADDPLDLESMLSQLTPDDRARRETMLAESLSTGKDYRMEYSVTLPNGEQRALELRGKPVFGRDQRVTGLAGVSLDVTGARRDEASARLVRDELNHRLRNCMTTVAALATQTLRSTDSPDAFRASFGARLEALGRSLSLVGEDNAPDTLRGVLSRALEPYVEASADRFTFDGPDLPLGDRAVSAFGLVAHELATNAMKYGALSNAAGRVTVSWALTDGRVELVWREVDGPPVTPPTRRGFGSRLIERAAPLELDGAAALDYAPDGLVCRIEFPLKA